MPKIPIIVRTEEEIDSLMNDADEFESKYPGMSFEQGLHEMYRWLTEKDAGRPIE